jgi:hypothetical protein
MHPYRAKSFLAEHSFYLGGSDFKPKQHCLKIFVFVKGNIRTTKYRNLLQLSSIFFAIHFSHRHLILRRRSISVTGNVSKQTNNHKNSQILPKNLQRYFPYFAKFYPVITILILSSNAQQSPQFSRAPAPVKSSGNFYFSCTLHVLLIILIIL